MAVDTSMPVLVVDDYKTMIRIIRNLLKQLGFANVDEAGDGSAARDMPMTGYGCCARSAPMTGCRGRPSSWSQPNRRPITSSPPRRPA